MVWDLPEMAVLVHDGNSVYIGNPHAILETKVEVVCQL